MKSSWSLETSVVSRELKRFIAEKCAQVRAETRAPGHEMIPESKALFTAAEGGDWRGVVEALDLMRQCAREPQENLPKTRVVYPVEWAAVNEIGAALSEFGSGIEKYAVAFARDIITSIPPGLSEKSTISIASGHLGLELGPQRRICDLNAVPLLRLSRPFLSGPTGASFVDTTTAYASPRCNDGSRHTFG